VFGSETLEPEKANTLELGYQYAKDKFSIQALAYYSIVCQINILAKNIRCLGLIYFSEKLYLQRANC
jgi:outer membrane receptor protein involved in Fe transport